MPDEEKYELDLTKVSSNPEATERLNHCSGEISNLMNKCLKEIRENLELDMVEETGVRCMLIKTQIKALEIALKPFLENPESVVKELLDLCNIEEKRLNG